MLVREWFTQKCFIGGWCCFPGGWHLPSTRVLCVFSSIFILQLRESDQSAISSSVRSCRPPVYLTKMLEDREIPPSAFPNDTLSKLAGLVSTLSL